jgi:hypothetical protein
MKEERQVGGKLDQNCISCTGITEEEVEGKEKEKGKGRNEIEKSVLSQGYFRHGGDDCKRVA